MSPDNDIPQPGVRAQLERIVASAAFTQSQRMCRFLRMAVEYSLDNRGDELKEYPIALQVFDRKPSFDPRADPIVRVEARRLRSKLERYYREEGADDEIRIDLPKGNYAARFSRRQNAPAPASREAAVAVIPFANLSPGDENQYFSDGLTQDLILGLTRVQGLRIVAWTSAAQLRGAHDVPEIGRRLGVGAVLTGSVRKGADRVRVTAQLIDAATSSYLWSEAFDRELRDLLQIQEEISRAIVATLRIELAARFLLAPPRRDTGNFEAVNLYLKGQFESGGRTPGGLRRSVRYFEQAIELEPAFALGWAGLAASFTLLGDYGLAPPKNCMPRARNAALKAVELEPSLGEAWNSLAMVYGLFDWKHAEAEDCFRRAIRLNPGYSVARHWFAVDHLAMLGRFDEADAEIRLARVLDPLSPIIIEGEALIQLLRGRYDEAIRTSRQTLELDPKFYKSLTSLGRALIEKGDYQQAIEALEQGRALAGDLPNILGALGQAHALAGNKAEARRTLRKLETERRDRSGPSTAIAIVHLGLGETDPALDALETACERRETSLSSLKVHPVYAPLRGLPRYQALLNRIHLT